MRQRAILAWLAAALSTVPGATPGAGQVRSGPAAPAAQPETISVEIAIHPHDVLREISPQFLGTNLTQYKTDRAQMQVAATQERVRGLGIATLRFPNGCFADLYNWQQPGEGEVTVEAFIAFCDAIGAEPYYTLNMQGGTEGLEGKPADGAPLDEVIRYRHTAPNPCNYTHYYFGTLPEALALFQKHTIERALAGKTPILHYELGNENWGQATTDWPPAVYGRNAEVWSRALRDAWARAQTEHPQLRGRRLWIVAVGYPTMGNNQDPLKAVNPEINRAWTAEINRLAEAGLIDAVTEHFYPFPSNTGDALFWTVHNLHNILALRTGTPNQRLGGYHDPSLAYRVPIEVTEWNLKCWGRNRVRFNLPLVNGDFEEGLKGWTVDPPSQSGSARAITTAARRGKLGLELRAGPAGEAVTLRQQIDTARRENWAGLGAYLWVRTPTPQQVEIAVRPADHSGGPLKGVPSRTASRTEMWERLVVMCQPEEQVRAIELSITVRGPGGMAWVDAIVPAAWETMSDNVPTAVDRYEHVLFAVDAFREMLNWPVTRTHWHHLFGNYGCGQLKADGSPRATAAAFELLAGRIGSALVRTECDAPELRYETHADAIATDFNAMTPDTGGIPALGVVTTRAGERLFVLLINRTTDRAIRTRVRVQGATVADRPRVHVLSGADLDLPDVKLTQAGLAVKDLEAHVVAPLSAQVLELTIR